ncbi:MAG TPA: hypothetical protein VGK46_01025 [Saprospiraceae bacterium]
MSKVHISAQQFNSDSWLSKPHGVMTIIPTFGERSSMLMNTFSLLPRWEFTMAAYLYNSDKDSKTDDGYSTSFYAKYMIYENRMQNGGFAVKVGTGTFPGTIDPELREKDAFKTYWMNAPITIPFFDNKLSWDIMPGASLTRNFGPEETTAWAFTYSTRVAYNPWGPKFSCVGEVFGTEGETGTLPEYKVGLRYDVSPNATFAFTYGQEFTDNNGSGFEIGAMLFTPPFVKLGKAGRKKQEYQ